MYFGKAGQEDRQNNLSILCPCQKSFGNNFEDSYSSCRIFMVNISVIIKWGVLTTPRTAKERPLTRLHTPKQPSKV